MASRRIRIAAVIAAGLLAATGTAAATTQEQPRTAAAASAASGGIVRLGATFNLQPYASGTWVNTPLYVDLPSAGVYDLDLNVQGRVAGRAPINGHIYARLTANGQVMPGSQRLVDQVQSYYPTGAGFVHRDTAPVSERIRVSGPTRIRLQAMRLNVTGTTTIAEIRSDTLSKTTFRWEKV